MSTTADSKRQARRLRPWTALQQGFLRRPDVMRLSKDAKLLYWAMTDHACEQMTDGVIQDVELPLLFAMIAANASALAELSKAGIVKHSDSTYQLTEHLEYSRSREEREAARAGARERKARQRGAPVTRDITRPITRSVSATEIEVEIEKESEAANRASHLRKGDLVSHPKYGLGELLYIDSKEATVRFETGVKRIYPESLTAPAPTPSPS